MPKKKILLIYPSSYDSQNRLTKARKSFFPARTLPYLAGLTPKHFEIRIIDELVDGLSFNEDADLVVLTGMLRHMPRAIDIAREFKKRGIPSIIGGVGAYSIHDKIDKSSAFDSLIMGEVDQLWEAILDDFDRGRLKRHYNCPTPQHLNNLPPARFDLLNQKKYMKSFYESRYPIIAVETSRGCPHNCKFCLVSRFFGRKMRYRPISEVVDEIKHHKAKFFMFTDDNIAINPERAKELFLAVKPLGIKWLGQFESRVALQPELLNLAGKSGCRGAIVGIESLLPDNLHSVDKSRNTKVEIKDVVKGFKKADVPLLASLIFGMDFDTPETIDWTVEEAIKHGVNTIIPWIFTPIPGTPFYDECKRENRILHENYSLYDHWHSVIQPKRMTPEELEESLWRGLKRFYSFPLILSRTYEVKKWDLKLPGFLYQAYFRKQINKRQHIFTEKAW